MGQMELNRLLWRKSSHNRLNSQKVVVYFREASESGGVRTSEERKAFSDEDRISAAMRFAMRKQLVGRRNRWPPFPSLPVAKAQMPPSMGDQATSPESLDA